MTDANNIKRVRKHEASRRGRGEKEIRVWVPDRPDAIAKVRSLAKKLCLENARVKRTVTD